MSDIGVISDHLDKACCPEDVFGNVDAASVVSVYKKLARSVHPDLHAGDLDTAKKAFQRLNMLREEADKRIAKGEWGKRLPLIECQTLQIGSFEVERKPLVGDIADVYRVKDQDLIVKIARHNGDNDLMRAEASSLKTLAAIDGPVRDGVPELADSFLTDEIRKRCVNVVTRFPGFVTAQEVTAKLGDTLVDNRTGVWMFKRILSLLSWVHHFGLIHGAILPPHVLFYPDNDGSTTTRDSRKHSIRLIDWCYSVEYQHRTKLSSWVPAWEKHYAPELLSKKAIGPFSDIYMAANLMTYLCGSLWHPELGSILVKCVNPDPAERYQKASDVLDDWIEASAKAYGKPKWVDFNLP